MRSIIYDTKRALVVFKGDVMESGRKFINNGMINDAKRIRNVESTTAKSVSKILKISIIYCCCELSLIFLIHLIIMV